MSNETTATVILTKANADNQGMFGRTVSASGRATRINVIESARRNTYQWFPNSVIIRESDSHVEVAEWFVVRNMRPTWERVQIARQNRANFEASFTNGGPIYQETDYGWWN
jgi:hypothetical protein|tara:strand:+ start:190 stop:522 length:333 start_codon:yes stop_codon:yes gene_type:complete